MEDYAPGVSPDDVISVTFHVMQNGKPVSKEIKLKRGTFIKYNAMGMERKFTKNAQLYELIVADKVYISITDLANSN